VQSRLVRAGTAYQSSLHCATRHGEWCPIPLDSKPEQLGQQNGTLQALISLAAVFVPKRTLYENLARTPSMSGRMSSSRACSNRETFFLLLPHAVIIFVERGNYFCVQTVYNLKVAEGRRFFMNSVLAIRNAGMLLLTLVAAQNAYAQYSEDLGSISVPKWWNVGDRIS
jgi:hypothetical protein